MKPVFGAEAVRWLWGRRVLLLVSVLPWLAVTALAEEEHSERARARAVLVTEAPEIDGRLDEAVWEMA